ncbi:helix-turn-helix transcriptional regulator [Anaerorhabdus sp.]|uniref:helix-turn-helix transcriptional regulator n=1 Tax=Anaerorhabdus sp. TaxID=1872524 RepID=UPI002FC78527
MSIGSKLSELRKKNNYSQEDLAEKLNVTRQTISKWELDETSPDLNSAKQLSIIFQISLDDLVDNDIKNIVVEKVSNTEKLAGIIIDTLKVIGIGFVILIILSIVIIFVFNITQSETSKTTSSVTMACEVADESYLVKFGSDGYFDCKGCNDKMLISLMDFTDWANIDTSIENVNNYFESNGGQCRVMSSEESIPAK